MAFLIAPVPIPFLLSLVLVADLSFSRYWFGVGWLSLIALPQCYLCELLFGVPLWAVFHRQGLRDWWMFASGGILSGGVYWVVYCLVDVLAETKNYHFLKDLLSTYLNPGSPVFILPVAVLCALFFRAVIFPWRAHKTSRTSAA